MNNELASIIGDQIMSTMKRIGFARLFLIYSFFQRHRHILTYAAAKNIGFAHKLVMVTPVFIDIDLLSIDHETVTKLDRADINAVTFTQHGQVIDIPYGYIRDWSGQGTNTEFITSGFYLCGPTDEDVEYA
jgi:hypothetical protein